MELEQIGICKLNEENNLILIGRRLNFGFQIDIENEKKK
jgi:hypothetical protein